MNGPAVPSGGCTQNKGHVIYTDYVTCTRIAVQHSVPMQILGKQDYGHLSSTVYWTKQPREAVRMNVTDIVMFVVDSHHVCVCED